jgi:hypothetical protein
MFANFLDCWLSSCFFDQQAYGNRTAKHGAGDSQQDRADVEVIHTLADAQCDCNEAAHYCPAMPSRIVITMSPGSSPGIKVFAGAPAMSSSTIQVIIPKVSLLFGASQPKPFRDRSKAVAAPERFMNFFIAIARRFGMNSNEGLLKVLSIVKVG